MNKQEKLENKANALNIIKEIEFMTVFAVNNKYYLQVTDWTFPISKDQYEILHEALK